MNRTSVVVAQVLLVLVPVACGGNGGGGAGTFSTSVPGNRPLNDLSTTELATICADAMKFRSTSTLQADSCKLSGFLAASLDASFSPSATDAELEGACTQALMSCTTTPSTTTCDPAPANCTATVAELTACANDNAALEHNLASQVPACSADTRATVNAKANILLQALTLPPSCQTYEAKCPATGAGGTGGTPDGGASD